MNTDKGRVAPVLFFLTSEKLLKHHMEGSTVETTMAPFVLATPEYARVTSYISLLKTKRERALKDIQSLKKLKEEYLLNPKQLIDQTIARVLQFLHHILYMEEITTLPCKTIYTICPLHKF